MEDKHCQETKDYIRLPIIGNRGMVGEGNGG